MTSATSIHHAEQMALQLAGHSAAGEVSALWHRLAPTEPTPAVFDPSLVMDLPEPARRWLTHAIAPATPLAGAVVLEMHGHIRIGRWLPFQAIQLQVPPDGYLWVARAGRGPVSIRGYDSYADGTGQMRWRLLGRVPLINAAGPDLDRSAAGRVALDAFTVPISLAHPVRHLARRGRRRHRCGRMVLRRSHAASRDPGRSGRNAAFGDHATVGFAARRAMGGYACWGILEGEASFGGITMPTRMRAGYFLGTERWGEGEFFRATITDAHFL